MYTKLIQRHYDEVIAPHYDLDPQSVLGDSLDRALAQILEKQHLGDDGGPFKVLDVGMGTGRFLEKLTSSAGRAVQPFGLDLSERMVEVARERIPDLVAVVDDAANLDAHFQGDSFDLVSTHFITGFVPLSVLAPKIWSRLAEGGYWSIVGGTKAGFPTLQQKASAAPLRWLFGGRTLDVDKLVCNPTDCDEMVCALESEGFAVRQRETFDPPVHFGNLSEFLDFGYWGGWLTPFIETLGLHQASALVRLVLNTLVFPVKDHHSIAIVLAQKVDR